MPAHVRCLLLRLRPAPPARASRLSRPSRPMRPSARPRHWLDIDRRATGRDTLPSTGPGPQTPSAPPTSIPRRPCPPRWTRHPRHHTFLLTDAYLEAGEGQPQTRLAPHQNLKPPASCRIRRYIFPPTRTFTRPFLGGAVSVVTSRAILERERPC
ncbi:hypothetical protein M433DRAFT_523284 [Acidomyces richmondensis BFW]|nr:MAG: hypothetical protein FE78DRAFT_329332 [Acidomyces sp. 'richmondensis']KYG47023.1 hypothetical protein M433DRAFT_523284 [Acidomyces richmondensis BFW]